MHPEAQGTQAPCYKIIPRTLIFLTRPPDDVLLLQGAADKRLWAGKYNGLGGHIEPGETPRQTAVRELQEEAGLTVPDLKLRAVIHVTMPEPPGVMLFVFVAPAPAAVSLSPSEEGTPVWVHRDALTSLPLVDDLPELLPRVLSPGPLVFGRYLLTETGMHIAFE
ncbi:MAG: NUDIX domain-containing protein [Chloroflexi bacterium]|jgi:8-oxo-dGTP diphosphatase|nr:NUDIX domain-containing protein [Chloroflexota bacterium]